MASIKIKLPKSCRMESNAARCREVKDNCCKHFEDIFTNLRKSPDLFIRLKCEKSSKLVKANKCIIEAFNPGIMSKLDLIKRHNDVIFLDNLGFFITDFVNMIDFIYSGVTTLSLFNINSMLHVAGYFRVEKLVGLIAGYIRSVLNNDNCLHIFLVLCKNDAALEMNEYLRDMKISLKGYVQLCSVCSVIKDCKIYKYSTEDILYLLQNNFLSELKDAETACDFATQMLDRCHWNQHTVQSAEVYNSDLNAAKAAQLAISFMLEGFGDMHMVQHNECLLCKVLFLNLTAQKKLGITDLFDESLKKLLKKISGHSPECKNDSPLVTTTLASLICQTCNKETRNKSVTLDKASPPNTRNTSAMDNQVSEGSTAIEMSKDKTMHDITCGMNREDNTDMVNAGHTLTNSIKEEPQMFPVTDNSRNRLHVPVNEKLQSSTTLECPYSVEVDGKIYKIEKETVEEPVNGGMLKLSIEHENDTEMSDQFYPFGNDVGKDIDKSDLKHEIEHTSFSVYNNENEMAKYGTPCMGKKVMNVVQKTVNRSNPMKSLIFSESHSVLNLPCLIVPTEDVDNQSNKRKITNVLQKSCKIPKVIQKREDKNDKQNIVQPVNTVEDRKSGNKDREKTESSGRKVMLLPKCRITKVVKKS